MMLEALTTLASGSASTADRRRAAAALDAVLDQRLGRMLGSLRTLLNEADLLDVKQHVLLEASVGSSRFRGSSAGEAHNWCRMVARNKATDLLGGSSKMSSLSGGRDDEQDEPGVPAACWVLPDTARLTKQAFDRALAAMREVLEEDNPGDGGEKADRIECLVEYRTGATIEEQIDAWAWPAGGRPASPTTAELKAARNRVYKYRERGAAYGKQALTLLAAEGDLDEAELELLRTVLGIEPGSP
jgi:hypothetical protein